MYRGLRISHNNRKVIVPLEDNTVIFIIERHPDGSMDAVLSIKDSILYFDQVLPDDTIKIEFIDDCNGMPALSSNYSKRYEVALYYSLKNQLEGKILYGECKSLGFELTTSDGVYTGLLKDRVVTITTTYVRGEIMIQFGAMDDVTFDTPIWYYDKFNSGHVDINIKNVSADSPIIEEYSNAMKKKPTAEELKEYERNKHILLNNLEKELKEEGLI